MISLNLDDPLAGADRFDERERHAGVGLIVHRGDVQRFAFAQSALGFEHDAPSQRASGVIVCGRGGFDVQVEAADTSAGGLAPAVEGRGNDLAFVEDEQVAGLEQVGQIADVSMGEGGVGAVDRHEPGGVALGRGRGGDERLGQVVIEVFDVHGGILFHGAAVRRSRVGSTVVLVDRDSGPGMR